MIVYYNVSLKAHYNNYNRIFKSFIIVFHFGYDSVRFGEGGYY